MRRTYAVAVAALGALSLTGSAEAVQDPGPLVKTGDIDLLEDVLEHISVPIGPGGRAVHQMYDSRTAES
ncbi:hypothetical protein P8605_24610 [Streptomyces sp. T-3]|nr:hypothetical protein [Streptomyces sp. T-3]